MEIDDEHQIQHDVEHGGQQQEIQRALAVAQRAHDGRSQIIQNHGGNAQQHGGKISVGFVDDVGRRLHPDENLPRQRDGNRRDDQSHRRGKPDTVGHIFAQILLVMRAEALCNRDGQSRAGTHAEAQNQELQRAHRAHCGQRVHPQILTDDDAIGHAVKLLEEVAENQRQRKSKNMLRRTAEGHISGQRSIRHHNPPFNLFFGKKLPAFR